MPATQQSHVFGRPAVHAGPPRSCLLDPRAARRLARARGRDARALELVDTGHPFRANDYYLGNIDWDDPHDPIARLILPSLDELRGQGYEDPSDEASNTKLVGLQHKYEDTALLLVTDQCAGFCRYCFRKRLFQEGQRRETTKDVGPGLDYISAHPEIHDVLLTGGDPLTLPASRLIEIVDAVRAIPHVKTIRIGSKMPAFNPSRILHDTVLQRGLEKASKDVALYIMCHFDHPRELTGVARDAIKTLRELGAQCVNQCPITAGVNDSVDVLAELLEECSLAGCPQYYVFQCRPAVGNASFVVPIVRAYTMFEQACSRVSGLSRRARFCMSHSTGKIEIVGLDNERIYATYHRAKRWADQYRMLVMKRDDTATWWDQLSFA
jgi:lysine 2,3-aminomutase